MVASETTNYGLVTPAGNDYYDIGVANGNMDKVDTALKANADAAAAARSKTKAFTLTAAGWVGETAPFTQEVAVAGITGIMNPLTDIILSEETDTAIAELEAWGMVSSITTGDGKITARCLEDKPEVDLNLQMKAVQ